MLVECSNCGAPLDVKEGANKTKCNYCQHSNVVQRTRTIAVVTPAGWEAPKVWTPPAHVAAQSKQLAYKAGGAIASFTLIMILLPIVLTCLIGGVVSVIMWQVSNTVDDAIGQATQPFGGPLGSPLGQTIWTGATPMSCGLNDSVTFTGISANLPGQTVIDAGGNCHVTLINCNITGALAINASGNAQVIMQGGSANGSPMALNATGNARINIVGAQVTGTTNASGNAQITGVP